MASLTGILDVAIVRSLVVTTAIALVAIIAQRIMVKAITKFSQQLDLSGYATGILTYF